jgi:hypothetical protein
MSAEKENLERLAEKIDELLVVMNQISEILRTVSASIKSTAVTQTAQPAPQTPAQVSHEIHEKKRSLEDIRMMFPPELDAMLNFEEKGDYIIIKPKQYLGSDNFAKIASTVRGIGGEYISAGKDSHFRVYKKKP